MVTNKRYTYNLKKKQL